MKMFPVSLILSLALMGCDNRDRSPSDVFLIPKQQLAAVINSANNGDIKSVKRLIYYYESSSEDEAMAEKWRAKARSLGDAQELYYYAAKIYTGARSEPDSTKK